MKDLKIHQAAMHVVINHHVDALSQNLVPFVRHLVVISNANSLI
jgi:hypothetical protein